MRTSFLCINVHDDVLFFRATTTGNWLLLKLKVIAAAPTTKLFYPPFRRRLERRHSHLLPAAPPLNIRKKNIRKKEGPFQLNFHVVQMQIYLAAGENDGSGRREYRDQRQISAAILRQYLLPTQEQFVRCAVALCCDLWPRQSISSC